MRRQRPHRQSNTDEYSNNSRRLFPILRGHRPPDVLPAVDRFRPIALYKYNTNTQASLLIAVNLSKYFEFLCTKSTAYNKVFKPRHRPQSAGSCRGGSFSPILKTFQGLGRESPLAVRGQCPNGKFGYIMQKPNVCRRSDLRPVSDHITGGQPCLPSQEFQRSPILGVLLQSRMTNGVKFGMVTHMGRGVF